MFEKFRRSLGLGVKRDPRYDSNGMSWADTTTIAPLFEDGQICHACPEDGGEYAVNFPVLARSLCFECMSVFCIAERSWNPETRERYDSRHLRGHMAVHCTETGHGLCCGLEDLSFFCHQCEVNISALDNSRLSPIYAQLHKAKTGEYPLSNPH